VKEMPKKLMIFIDGQNLFFGCKGFDQDFKYDIDKLVEVLKSLEPDCELVEVFYYSSIKPPDPNVEEDNERFQKQQRFYEMLKFKYQVYIKRTKMKEIKCKLCGRTFFESKEKGIDVAVATDFLLYGLVGEYDVAIIVSGDSDLAPVIKKLRERKPSLRIYIAQFKHMVGVELKQVCHKFFQLDDIARTFEMAEK
jgi:uncharacterized LabA/DUF88 family protein